MCRKLIRLLLAGLVTFVCLDLAARPGPPRINGISPTQQGYLIKGTGFGTNKALIRIQEGRITLPAQAILSVSPTGIAVNARPRPGVPVSIKVRMGRYASNPWRYTPPRSVARKPAVKASSYTLTVGVLKQVGGRNYGISQANVTLSLGNKKLRSGKTDTKGHLVFANTAPSGPRALYQLSATASGCQPSSRSYKMAKYNSKVNLVLKCAAPAAARQPATAVKKPAAPSSADTRTKTQDPRLQARQPIPVEKSKLKRSPTTPGPVYMALSCLGTPELYSQSQPPPYNGTVFPGGGVTDGFNWNYDGCITYFHLCWNLASLNRGPDSQLCNWQGTGPGRSFKLSVGEGPYSVVVGEEAEVRVKACYTGIGSNETECGDWSNMLTVKVALENARLNAPGSAGSRSSRYTNINTRQPTFSWQPVPEATRYKVLVHKSAPNPFPVPPFDVGTATSFTPSQPLDAALGNQVMWEVKSCKVIAGTEVCSHINYGATTPNGVWDYQHGLFLPAAGGGGGLASACDTIRQVVVSPRCVNCHNGNAPLVGNNGAAHPAGISRGSTDCARCHNGGPDNNPPFTPNVETADEVVPWAGPGLPLWNMPAIDRNWQGLNANTIIQRMANTNLNGGMSLAQVVTHVDEDHLIVWAWNPTNALGDTQGRTAAFGTHQGFVGAMQVWATNGGTCP